MLIWLADQQAIVVSSILILNMMFLCYMCEVRPHDNPTYSNLELKNELILHIICIHISLSIISTGVYFDDILGWSLCGWIGLLLFVNLYLISAMTFRNMKAKYDRF